MNFLEPWYSVEDSDPLNRELLRELPVGHCLYQVQVNAVARRQDCDDVLFALEDGSGRVAVVHLSYAVEKDPVWPFTRVFPDMYSFSKERMVPDNAEFG